MKEPNKKREIEEEGGVYSYLKKDLEKITFRGISSDASKISLTFS